MPDFSPCRNVTIRCSFVSSSLLLYSLDVNNMTIVWTVVLGSVATFVVSHSMFKRVSRYVFRYLNIEVF